MPGSRRQLAKLVSSHLRHQLYRCPSTATTKPLNLVRRVSTTTDESTQQNPVDPIPNRPLRGQKQHPNDQSSQNTKRVKSNNEAEMGMKKNGSSFDFAKRVGGGFENDASFLEKFKLNVQKKEKNVTLSGGNEEVNEGEDEGPPPDADEIFKKMKETGLIPNAVAMLDGLCKDGLVQEAMKLFGVMREKGTIPEVVVYTAVVEGFCMARKVEDAKRVFRKMQGNGIVPNAFSYGVFVVGLCKCDKLDDAVEIALEMLDAGHSPNVTTFVGLVDGLCREKGVDGAKDVITKLMQKGFFLNEKAIKEFLEKKKPFSPPVWEAIFGKKSSNEKLF